MGTKPPITHAAALVLLGVHWGDQAWLWCGPWRACHRGDALDPGGGGLQLPLHHHNRVQDETIGFPGRQKSRGANRGSVLDTIWALLQLRVSFPIKARVCPQCASPLIRAGVMLWAWQRRVRSLRAQHRTLQEGCPGKHPSLRR
jgi:hypothetical protein